MTALVALPLVIGILAAVAWLASPVWTKDPADPIDAPGERQRPLLLVALGSLGLFILLLIGSLVRGNITLSVTGDGEQAVASSGSNDSGGAGPKQYQTVGTEVRVRDAATTHSAILATMLHYGSTVTLHCYQTGESIHGDLYWYQADYGSVHGWVAGFWLGTGPDPASASLPHC